MKPVGVQSCGEAGPGGYLTQQHPRQRITAPVIAGVGILFIASLVVGVISMIDHEAYPTVTDKTVVTGVAKPGSNVRVVATTNIRSEPNRLAELVAILPREAEIRMVGRTSDDAWVQVAFPPESSTLGWAAASSLRLDQAFLNGLPIVLTIDKSVPNARETDPQNTEPLPDLMISDAFLLQDGRLAITIRNIGQASLRETTVPLIVSRMSGDILGVLRIGPATLSPGSTATVVTPVVVTETGNYQFQLDRADEIRELSEFNNLYTALLLATGG